MPTPIWTIENAVTQEIFVASITRLAFGQRVAVGKPTFSFKWKAELGTLDRQAFKLTTVNNPGIIHGLLSLSPNQGCVKMHLLESARFNQGPNKQYLHVAGNLIAYACRLSHELGNEGYVAFTAKSELIDHYQRKYGATQLRQQLMAIEPAAARRLLNQYFNGYFS